MNNEIIHYDVGIIIMKKNIIAIDSGINKLKTKEPFVPQKIA